MSINLYRRHRPECEGGHEKDSRSGEFEERKKSWKRCDCQVFASGTLGRKFSRHCTEKTDWDEARAVAALWEKRMAMLKPFFEYCVSNKWIPSNPARAVKNPKGRGVTGTSSQPKFPFTDQEVQRMYKACEEYGKTYRHRWGGDDITDFISLSIYTGLRISDVATFHADRMLDTGEIHIRTTKTRDACPYLGAGMAAGAPAGAREDPWAVYLRRA
jgi:integrase